MPDRRPAIVVVTRFPVAGRVKTRLIPALGPERAADLHRELGRRTIIAAREAAERAGCAVEVHHDGGDAASLEAWLGQGLRFEPQAEGDLGRRLERAAASASSRSGGSVVLIGTDCPALGARHIRAALAALDRYDVAIGPARDGGYYLMALARPAPELFADVPWGTDRVLEVTLRTAARSGRSVHLMEELADVDRPGDLALLPESLGEFRS